MREELNGPDDGQVPEHTQLSPEELKAFADIERTYTDEIVFQGVPVWLAMDYNKRCAAFVRELQDGVPDAADCLHDDIEANRGTYPDAVFWDSLYAITAEQLYDHGDREAAMDQVWRIREPHRAVDVLFTLATRSEGDPMHPLQTIVTRGDSEKNILLVRATRDRFIGIDPKHDGIDNIEAYLLGEGIESSPVEGWLESQAMEFPGISWNNIRTLLHDESLWGDTPMRWRQHSLYHQFRFSSSLSGDLELDLPLYEEQRELIIDMTAAFPSGSYWDEMAIAATMLSLEHGHEEVADTFADTLTHDHSPINLIQEAIRSDYESFALQRALMFPDATRSAKLLIEAQWTQPQLGVEILQAAMHDDTLPTDRRIGYLEYLATLVEEEGMLIESLEIRHVIDELKAEE